MGLWSYSGATTPRWPEIIDKLMPSGKIDPAADHQQGLAVLLPSLLQSLAGQSSSDAVSSSIAPRSVGFADGL